MRDRLLQKLADVVSRRPWLIVLTAAGLAILASLYAAMTLRLNANLDDLIAQDRPYMVDYRRFIEEFGDLEHIIIAVDASSNRAQATQSVDALVGRLRSIDGVEAVHGFIEPEEQMRLATRAMEDAELRDLAMASDALPSLRSGDPRIIAKQANSLLTRLTSGGAAMSRENQERLLAAATLMLESIAAAAGEGNLPFAMPDRTYLESDTGRLMFINVQPLKNYSTLAVIEEPLRRIREVIDEVAREHAGIEIGLTGKPVMQYDEVAISNRDMLRATMVALVLCGGLFMLVMRGVQRPLLAIVAFGFAAAWTHGFAAVAVGQLNLLSLVFMLVLIGVGLDYGVHVINRYQESLSRGAAPVRAVREAVLGAVRGNITGALTSSIVFFMALLTTFQGLRELGVIAGAGLLLCLVAMSVVLPALLMIAERRRQPESQRVVAVAEKPVRESWMVRRAGSVLAATAAITIAALLVFAFRGGMNGWFDSNLLNLQARGLESVEWEHRILQDSAAASWFGAVIAPTQKRAIEAIERAKQMPTIGMIRSAFDLIEPESPQREAWRKQLHTEGAPSEPAAAESFEESLGEAAQMLELIGRGAGREDEVVAARLLGLAAEIREIDAIDSAMLARMERSLQTNAQAVRLMLEGDRLPLREALPRAVRDQFISPGGSYLVMLHPRDDVWDAQAMAAFIADLKRVDPSATGVPMTHFESLVEMRRSFVTMSLLALLAIVVLLTVDFRGLSDVALALLPLALGGVWTLAAMRLLGFSFNLANFFAAPMLIGLSVDSAVHMLHRHHEGEDAASRLHFGRTRRAVILTALTTTIGFGALLLAHHRGLRSLGVVMAIGSLACMMASIYVLPALLAWRERRPGVRL